MIAFPNCKINLGLRILRKRTDGYHDLETVFYPLPFYDVLEIVHSNDSSIRFSTTGLTVESGNDNLCVKAYELLKKDYPDLPLIQMHLHKTIPMGAGLGGGSADAAFVLTVLNKKFHLNISKEKLIEYALQLGSDCPFFIYNKPCYATGRGEIMEDVNIDLSSYSFVIINPGIHVSTAKAFAGINPVMPSVSVKEIIQQPVSTWKSELLNDFEQTIFPAYKEIEVIKETLYNNGAVYAAMSGTGSTVYGIFNTAELPDFNFPSHYFVKSFPRKR